MSAIEKWHLACAEICACVGIVSGAMIAFTDFAGFGAAGLVSVVGLVICLGVAGAEAAHV